MTSLREILQRMMPTRYARSLEAELARMRTEIERLRDENRALLNSILGIAGLPPVIVDEKQCTERGSVAAAFRRAQPDSAALKGAPTNAGTDGSIVEITLPSILLDEFADNHAAELDVCLRWLSSDAGQFAKIESPAGFANVRAHALLHRDYLRKQQAQSQQGVAPPRIAVGPPKV